ncbi:putative membrane-bound transcription factor site-2 protease-like [Capsicum annuum]|nr:putative membrane-bound transcription factor site-2 protease-like [Capsicum annuum]
MLFGNKGKLSHRYIGPYQILRRIDGVAYELEFPASLGSVHPAFHISMLKKCIGDYSLVLPVEEIKVSDSLSYEEESVEILDCQVRKLRSKEIASVKVLWRKQKIEEATWESEDDIRARYPNLFDPANDEMEGMNDPKGDNVTPHKQVMHILAPCGMLKEVRLIFEIVAPCDLRASHGASLPRYHAMEHVTHAPVRTSVLTPYPTSQVLRLGLGVLISSRYFRTAEQSSVTESDFDAKPMVMLLGQHSTGKTTFIKYLLKHNYPDERSIPGNTIVVQTNFPITDLTKFDDSAVGNFPLKELKKLSPMPTKEVTGCIRNVSLIDDVSYMESISGDTTIADHKQIPFNKFLPTLRSGEWSDIGGRRDIEDTHICIADIAKNFGHSIRGEESISFYGVFDGHGGKGAALFVRDC